MRRHLPPEPISQAALWSRRLGLFAAVVAALALALMRLHVLEPVAALTTLGAAVAISLGALLLFVAACVTIWRSGARGLGIALGGLFFIAATLAYPSYLAFEAVKLPKLADVSTDIADPPDFSRSAAALAARGGVAHANPPPESRAGQRSAYPDVEPIVLDIETDEAVPLVLKSAAARGWRLVDQRAPSPRSGEAHLDFLDTSRIFGFDVDVTVRLRPLPGQTRVDVRSASRYGRHDFGSNAHRIQAFADELQNQLDEREETPIPPERPPIRPSTVKSSPSTRARR
ncbi:DUF1499 domain-containing protein [Methylocystis bryophila]|uniref:DUF1499 domain-containing protein n=1 Tax=Methylocystis bryophila TaxID=655015 RepID=A0A1W6MWQ0_9HYPH|nr:DUF1499 domain-containing protein [Methylocystis bryophila]ARN82010.1 hypothetical protein B1812_14010 [Methylocystis bryophila]BDV38120.1 hypothetical protein DSM21852_13730 [Methylocystis bryophila]